MNVALVVAEAKPRVIEHVHFLLTSTAASSSPRDRVSNFLSADYYDAQNAYLGFNSLNVTHTVKQFEIMCSLEICHFFLQLNIIVFFNEEHESPGEAEDLSSPKPGHTTSGSGRGARRSGGMGSGNTGCQHNFSPRRRASLVPSKSSETGRLNDPPEARTNEILCKPMEEQNPRLTTG